MKNIFRLLAFVGMLSFAACEDKDGLNNWFEKPEANNDLVLTMPEELSIDPDTQWNDIDFTWNTPTPPTEDYHISGYMLRIRMRDDANAAPYVVKDIPADANSCKVLQRNLYKFMIANWVFKIGEPVAIEADLLASIEGGQFYYKPMLSIASANVVAADIPVRRFFIRGAASEGAVPVAAVEVDEFYQSKDIVLKPNSEFILSTQSDADFPAFMCGEKVADFGYEIVYVESEEEAAEKSLKPFVSLDPYAEGANGVRNNYSIAIEYDVQDVTGVVYYGRYCTEEMWVVGDAAGGWSVFDKFNWGGYKNPEVNVLEAHFYDKKTSLEVAKRNGEGAFKLHNSAGYTNPTWRPVSGGADPRKDNRVSSNSGGDPKWVMPEGSDGYYRVEVNNADMTIKMIPIEAPKKD